MCNNWWHHSERAGIGHAFPMTLLGFPSVDRSVRGESPQTVASMDTEVPSERCTDCKAISTRLLHAEVSSEAATLFEHCRPSGRSGSDCRTHGLPLIGSGGLERRDEPRGGRRLKE